MIRFTSQKPKKRMCDYMDKSEAWLKGNCRAVQLHNSRRGASVLIERHEVASEHGTVLEHRAVSSVRRHPLKKTLFPRYR